MKDDGFIKGGSETQTGSDREPIRQRLVICFDGTWNNKDSSTNIFHIHNLVKEGLVKDHREDVFYQRRYYDEGVGTGLLEGVSGGGFGKGLDVNVREAYNWLIEHYSDAGKMDEVYVFGFSRGAYTARSLVGFIMRCGLLRRGAPITVNQLWKAYAHFGEFNAGLRKHLPIRELSKLTPDPWHRVKERDLNPPANESEALFMHWSRRIPIRFLGIYDTVGALGWDALAIPGLIKSKLALVHNMRLSTIVRECRHALAIDEHRSNFKPTPLLQFEGYGGYWDLKRAAQQRKRWDNKVEQRWFLGAHSNIGGGYDDNRLTSYPLAWMLEAAEKCGLVLDEAPPDGSATAHASERRDSYNEFTKGLWAHVIRAKRLYRRLDPPFDVRGTPLAAAKTGDPSETAGYSLRFVNPQLDDSVLELAKKDEAYAPPNVVSFAQRTLARDHGSGTEEPNKRRAILENLANRVPVHQWLASPLAKGWFVMWCLFALTGLSEIPSLFALSGQIGLTVLCVIGAILPLVDWGESRFNFWLARYPEDTSPCGPRRRAAYDVLMSLRALALLLVVIGLVMAITRQIAVGNFAYRQDSGLFIPWTHLINWWPVATAVCTTTFLLTLRDKDRLLKSLGAIIAAPLLLTLLGGALIVLSYWVTKSFQTVPGLTDPSATAKSASILGGLLLLLHFALAAIGQGFSFVRKPMLTANLGSIVTLQLKGFTPGKVRTQLDTWRRKLTPKGDLPPGEMTPAQRLQYYLKGCLWRDTFGLVPLYACGLSFGLWVGTRYWHFLEYTFAGVPVWLGLPLLAAAADWVENAVHLAYVRRYADQGTPSWVLVLTGSLATLIKFAAFTSAMILFMLVWVNAIGEVVHRPYGWRGLAAALLTIPTALMTIFPRVTEILFKQRSIQQAAS